MEKVQHGKSATLKKCNMDKCNMKITEAQPESQKHLRWRTLQQSLTTLVITVANLSIVDGCGDPGNTSGNSAK